MAEVGRPTVRSEEVNRKIEECASLGATVEEIAFYAGIHRDTLYSWMKDDKVLSDRIKELQERPILKARQTIVKALDDPEHSKWYLERKRKDEFSQRTEHTGKEGESLLGELTEVFRKKADVHPTGDSQVIQERSGEPTPLNERAG